MLCLSELCVLFFTYTLLFLFGASWPRCGATSCSVGLLLLIAARLLFICVRTWLRLLSALLWLLIRIRPLFIRPCTCTCSCCCVVLSLSLLLLLVRNTFFDHTKQFLARAKDIARVRLSQPLLPRLHLPLPLPRLWRPLAWLLWRALPRNHSVSMVCLLTRHLRPQRQLRLLRRL